MLWLIRLALPALPLVVKVWKPLLFRSRNEKDLTWHLCPRLSGPLPMAIEATRPFRVVPGLQAQEMPRDRLSRRHGWEGMPLLVLARYRRLRVLPNRVLASAAAYRPPRNGSMVPVRVQATALLVVTAYPLPLLAP